jgi:hypothetical protein
VSLTGGDNPEKVFNFFKSKGFSDVVAAAITGNFMQEASTAINPTIMEIGGNSTNPADAGAKGWGISQWTPGIRVIDIAKRLNVSGPIYELGTQLNIVYGEMQSTAPTGYQNLAEKIKGITDLTQATEFFRANYEGGTPGNRQLYAKQVFDKYGGTSAGTTSGTAAVTGTSAPSCNSAGSVNCAPAGTSATTGTLSETRQKVTCLAEAEYELWRSGKMGPSPNPPYPFLKYTEGADEEWCADFVSWLYNQAGYPLRTGDKWRVNNVGQVGDIGKQGQLFTYHSESSYIPKPGDMVIYNGGEHINMVVAVNTNNHTVTTIGGNQGNIQANNMSKVTKNTVDKYFGPTSIGTVDAYVSPKD